MQLPKSQGDRLKFIEDKLYWVGQVGTADLRRAFGVSKTQAAQDISRYREMQSVNVFYEPKLKLFVSERRIAPIITSQTFSRFLALAEQDPLIEGDVLDFALLSPPSRHVDILVAQSLVSAILHRQEIEVSYISLSSGHRKRWLAPHALASDGMRIHVRAYDHDRGRFGDFVVGRIVEVHGVRPAQVDTDEDGDWLDMINVRLVPNPALDAQRQQAVELDYGFRGVLEHKVRRAMLIYLNTRLLLHSEFAAMPKSSMYRPLVPEDQAAYDCLVDVIRNASGAPLQRE